MWSFIAGLVGAVVTVVVSAVAGPILGGMAGGAVSGAILGAVHGGLEGALKGAMWGAAFGGILGAGYGAFNAVGLGGAFVATAAVGGAVYAGVTGGAEGLANYAAGALGALYGSAIGNNIVNSGLSSQAQAGDGQESLESNPAIKEAAKNPDFEGVRETVAKESGTPKGLVGNKEAKVIGDNIKNGTFGKGNNPGTAPKPPQIQSKEALTMSKWQKALEHFYAAKEVIKNMVTILKGTAGRWPKTVNFTAIKCILEEAIKGPYSGPI